MPVSMPDNSRRDRLLLWAAHRTPWMSLAIGVVLLTTDYFPVLRVQIGVTAAVIGAVELGRRAKSRHWAVLCPRCTVPLNGGEQAGRQARTLRAVHWLRRHRVLGLAPTILMVLMVDVLILLNVHIGYGVIFLMYWSIEAALDYGYAVHRRLTPWCPQCRWRDEGDEEPAPDPVPPASVSVRT